MSWVSPSFKALRLACGLAVTVSASALAWVYSEQEEGQCPAIDGGRGHSTKTARATTSQKESTSSIFALPKVKASWTTNFKPSVTWDSNWDKRDPDLMVKPLKKNSDDKAQRERENEVKKSTPTASRYLYLIRHGQYNIDQKEDKLRTLTKLGQDQAQLTGSRLVELGLPYTRLVSSTMTRADETANIVGKGLSKDYPDLPRERCDLLREGAPIPPEPAVGHWRPEANQFHEDGARIEAAFRKYFHRAPASQTEDSHEVIVCHANVIRYFVCRALQFPPEAWLRMSLHNGSITQVTIRPSGRVVLRSLGDSGHMPADKLTTT